MAVEQAGPLSTSEDILLQEGLERFDAGRFWHAHESWEDLWNELKARMAPQREVLLIQGLIQTAALLLHHEQQKVRGVSNQWAKLEPKLKGWTVAWGLNISLHLEVISHYAKDVGTWELKATDHQIPRA
ncbi:MAG: DUF309 domain-containing protein [Candidatus Poseidonia sp.]|nr:DUF309 domain-containing protein [Poseidonia sp.]